MAEVVAVCTSQNKGEKKSNVGSANLVADFGIQGDGHATGESNRQVSLLSISSIEKMKALGLKIKPGDFAENITVKGMDVFELPIGSKLGIGNQVVLEITQIGKECHDRCAIFKQVGTCIMPSQGVFAKVVKGGLVCSGDGVKRL